MGRLAVLGAAVAVIMCMTVPPADRGACARRKPYDFDGNGYVDLAIGAPSMRVGSVRAARRVVVLQSSTEGSVAAGEDHHPVQQRGAGRVGARTISSGTG